MVLFVDDARPDLDAFNGPCSIFLLTVHRDLVAVAELDHLAQVLVVNRMARFLRVPDAPIILCISYINSVS